MTTGYLIDNQAGMYFLTFQVVDWVDIFSRKIYRDIMLDSFTYCRREKGLMVWAYVIMTNHVHCILSARNGNLSDVIRDLKRHTASAILKAIQSPVESRRSWILKRFEFSARSNVRNSPHQFWTHDNHAKEILSTEFLLQKMTYIHFNPVRAGFVEKAEDWLYSSARNYMLQQALIDIDLVDVY